MSHMDEGGNEPLIRIMKLMVLGLTNGATHSNMRKEGHPLAFFLKNINWHHYVW